MPSSSQLVLFNFYSLHNVQVFVFKSLEMSILKNLLECHVAIDIRIDCIKSIVNIKELNNLFNNLAPFLNAKQNKEVSQSLISTILIAQFDSQRF
jgi:hypothetical protein